MGETDQALATPRFRFDGSTRLLLLPHSPGVSHSCPGGCRGGVGVLYGDDLVSIVCGDLSAVGVGEVLLVE